MQQISCASITQEIFLHVSSVTKSAFACKLVCKSVFLQLHVCVQISYFCQRRLCVQISCFCQCWLIKSMWLWKSVCQSWLCMHVSNFVKVDTVCQMHVYKQLRIEWWIYMVKVANILVMCVLYWRLSRKPITYSQAVNVKALYSMPGCLYRKYNILYLPAVDLQYGYHPF